MTTDEDELQDLESTLESIEDEMRIIEQTEDDYEDSDRWNHLVHEHTETTNAITYLINCMQ
jgi:uncharacterized protein CbrC (UPF0167 family)